MLLYYNSLGKRVVAHLLKRVQLRAFVATSPIKVYDRHRPAHHKEEELSVASSDKSSIRKRPRSAVLHRPRDGDSVRQEILECIRKLTQTSKLETGETIDAITILYLKHCLVELVSLPKRNVDDGDGELAQHALKASVLDLKSPFVSHRDPALAAELACLTIQALCNCGAPGAVQQAEDLFSLMLNQHELFLCDKLHVNTDTYGDCLATLLFATMRKWHGNNQVPRTITARMDNMIALFSSLVEDPAIRLDWCTFGLNQVLYVYLKSSRPDAALGAFRSMLLSSKKSYLQPNQTSYNTVLQVLSNHGRVKDVERVLHHMLQSCQRDPNQTDAAGRDGLQPNHFSAMAWIASFARLPQDSLQRSTAGIDAEAAWIQIQEWKSLGMIDLTELDESIVLTLIVRAWALAHGQMGGDGRVVDSVPRLMDLWQKAKFFSNTNPWILLQFAEILLSAFDPFRDWPDQIQPLLDEMDTIISRQEMKRQQSWLELYKRFYVHWLSAGAMESSLNIWHRLDKMDPEKALTALKEARPLAREQYEKGPPIAASQK